MRFIKGWLLWILLSPFFLEARIGERLDEVRAMHGAGKEVGDQQVLFTVDDFDVTITFDQEISIVEIYTPRLGHNDQIRAMTSEDLKKIFIIQGQERSWQVTEEDREGRQTWQSADGKLFARYLPKFNTLTFEIGLKKLPQS